MSTAPTIKQHRGVPLRVILPLGAILVAMLPMLSVHALQLWSRPQYQFFPAVLVVFGLLVASRWPLAGWNCPSHGRALLARFCYAVGLAVFAVATARISPLLAWGGLLVLTAGMVLHGRLPLWGPWLLLILLVRLPRGLDEQFIQWLQAVTTQMSSSVLDVLHIEHIRQGNTIQLPGRELFVERACSGVVSLMTLVATGVVLSVWMRRSFVHGVLLAASGVVWAGALNILRICTIVVALTRYDVDLLEKTPHAILGMLTFLIGVGLLLSTDRLLSFLVGAIPVDPISDLHEDVEGNLLVAIWNRLNPAAPSPEEGADAEPSPDVDRGLTWRVADWALAAIALAIGGASIYAGIGPFRVTSRVPGVISEMNHEFMPMEMESWTFGAFEVVDRETGSDFGETSRIWRYQSGTFSLVIELDYPFQEWHELTACYRGQGWAIDEVTRLEETANAREVDLARSSYEHALLLFDLCKTDGSDYEVPAGDFLHPTWRRVRAGGNRWKMPTYLQMQAVVFSHDGEITQEIREEARQAFLEFRRRIVEALR